MPQTDAALKILGSFYLRFCVNRFIFGLLFLLLLFCCFYYGSFNCWGPLRLLKCFYLILCVVQVHGTLKKINENKNKNKKEHKKLP